jgi:putative oxidoreductase
MAFGLVLARAIVGLLMAAHGAQKLFGWFGGYGLTATGGYFDSMGFRPGRLFAALAGLSEFAGGLLLAAGLLLPVGAAVILSVMVVAVVTVHARNGLLVSSNGVELPVLYAVVAIALALAGPGPYSLDALLGLAPAWTPGLTAAMLALGAAGGLGSLAARRHGAPQEHPAAA